MPPTNKIEINKNPQDLKDFLEQKVLPHLTEIQREDLTSLADIKLGKEFLHEDYARILNFDPTQDRDNHFSMVLMSFYLIANAEPIPEFADVKKIFIEKVKFLAEHLYKKAFFRNSYESLEAWQSCRDYKEYRELFKGLNLIPNGSEERISGMSKELDELWSQPEVERALENEIADDHVAAGAGEQSSLVQIFRKEHTPISREEYGGYNELRPDLFPEKYEDYLQDLEDIKHPFKLNL